MAPTYLSAGLFDPTAQQLADLRHLGTDVRILAIVKPVPVVREPQVEPHAIECDVGILQGGLFAGGADALCEEYQMVWFRDDDLLAACRPRGLPIGNLTSQFWSNCYLHPFDLFVKRELGCKAYLRYVDDFALFSNSKHELWRCKLAINGALGGITPHHSRAQRPGIA